MTPPAIEQIANYMLLAGGVLLIAGGLVLLLARLNLPIGKLPGDIFIQTENGSFYFPVTTSILASILLSVVLNLIGRFLNR